MLNAISEQDRLKLMLNKQLIMMSYSCGPVKGLISIGADPNYRYDGSALHAVDLYDRNALLIVPSVNLDFRELHVYEKYYINSAPLKYYINSTPLILATNTFIGLSGGHMRQTIQTLLKNGADPSLMNNLQHNALYYAINRVRSSRYRQGTTGTPEVEIVKDIVSYMKSEDLDATIRWYSRVPDKYEELSPLEFTLWPDFGLTSSQQFEVAEILLNAGANPNSVGKRVINRLLERDMMSQLDFFMLFLAKGLKLDKKQEETLKENSILKFFIHSGVEFSGFFQNVKDDAELIDGLIKIKKCIRFKAQELAFSTWLKYGMREFLSSDQERSNIVISFLKRSTGKDLTDVADKLQCYLNADEISSLFFVELQESFVDGHAKEISELLKTYIANIPDLDKHIEEEFTKKRCNRKDNRNLNEQESEESLNDIRFLYEEEQKSVRNKQLGDGVYICTVMSCVCIAAGTAIYFSKPAIVTFKSLIIPSIRLDSAILLALEVAYTAALMILAVAIGAAVGYGAAKLYEKVGEEKSKNPSMGTWTALTNVLTPEGLKGKSIPEPAIFLS